MSSNRCPRRPSGAPAGLLTLVLLGLLAVLPCGPGATGDSPQVEAQPLVAQAMRVRDAMEALGAPLPEAVRRELAAIRAGPLDASAVRRVQSAFAPLCLVHLRVGTDGRLAATQGAAPAVLQEQGWRTFLVKVRNDARATGTLRVASPNARGVPNAPASEIPSRWLDLNVVESRPLQPALSGLELEYRVLQLYSRDAGRRRAELSFNVGELRLPPGPSGAPRPVLIREWRFPADAARWRAMNQCRLMRVPAGLRVISSGTDPYFGTDVAAGGGRMLLRFRARAEAQSFGQLFWWTETRPNPDGRHMVPFTIEEGDRFRDYLVRFQVEDDLAGIRIDPAHRAGWVEFSDISVSYEDDPGRHSAGLALDFRCLSSQVVTFRVRDENDRPATAAFVIRDDQGRVYPAQSKRLAPDFFFHAQIYRGNGETVRLPAGIYTVHCSRGPESVPEIFELRVADRPVTFAYRVRRWIDPAKVGWYSGDHHIHAAGCAHYTNPTEGVHPKDMARHIMGEDLKVGANLTWGPCFDFQKQFFTGKIDAASRYPYLLRYDIEVSGFGSHQSGHLCLLRLREQLYPGGRSKDHWPTLGLNTLRWAKRQGAVCGPAHSSIGLAGNAGRVDGREGPDGLPNFIVPRYDGIGANEFIVDVTHEVPGPDGRPVPAVDFLSTMNTDRRAEFNIWYHVLNCGYRPRASGETDFPCVSGERVGMGRVYVRASGSRLDYDDWCEGIREGRSYVSDGYHHLIDLRAAPASAPAAGIRLGEKGSELRLASPGSVLVTLQAAARHRRPAARPGAAEPPTAELPVELVVNGYPVERRMIPADGLSRPIRFEAAIARSSWLAVRIYPNAHTNPIFVLVDGKPIRASRASAEWCLKGVEQCWKSKQPTYAPAEQEEARRAYDHARQQYERILRESAE